MNSTTVFSRTRYAGGANTMYVLVIGSLVVVGVLGLLMVRMSRPSTSSGDGAATGTRGSGGTDTLFVYCAAGMRYPMEKIAASYKEEYGVEVQLQYGGSNTLLNQLEVSMTGDLYLAADGSYINLAREKKLLAESVPLAKMKPVIAVQKGNPRGIKSVADLANPDTRVALGNPDAAAIGKKVKKLLSKSGDWDKVNENVTKHGVFKPTVNEVANDVKLGSVDAGVIWSSTVAQYPELEAVAVPELDAGEALVEIGVLRSSTKATAALKFARYVGASDKGLKVFGEMGWNPIDGDTWAEHPELTFYAGSVNRRALEPIIKRFEEREGVTVNTVYNGCGILTAQMKTIRDQGGSDFPDMYMACDVYYLNTVQQWFEKGVNVSDTEIVIAVAKGNPKGIKVLDDLKKPGIRVAIGRPGQCTIGVLTKQLLESEGWDYAAYVDPARNPNKNVVTETATSALLVPAVTTGAADAVLAYRTDTMAEADKIEVITIDSPHAKAVQPFSVAESSTFKHLSHRLFDTIRANRNAFECVGFNWRLQDPDEIKAAQQRRRGEAPSPSDAATPSASGEPATTGAGGS